MSALDLSQEGAAINRSVKSVSTASIPANKSGTYAHWVLLYVQAPLRNAFSQGPPKPSVLKVQSTGEGELEELFEDFNDGRVQFALAKVKDPNTKLGKNVFFAWCGEGVPEHVKGNYGSYLSGVNKLFEGYHVQITARSNSDLNADQIMQKVSKASGSNYSAATSSSETAAVSKPAPPTTGAKPAWKPGQAYTPTRSFGNPAPSRGRTAAPAPVGRVDADGWGEDAPQVTRSQLEKVESAYKPTKVNIKELMQQPTSTTGGYDKPDVVRGAYQPIGKVDIAAIRAQGDKRHDHKPEIVKGAYQPIGKVDIAAIRASAQPPREEIPKPVPQDEDEPRSLSDRASAFNKPASSSYSSGRLTSLPKPKPAKAFGTGSAYGTKPNLPSEYGTGPSGIPSAAPVGTANKDFASQGGKTPQQIWQEKRNRERGLSGAQEAPPVSSFSTGGSGSGSASWSARAPEPPAERPAPELEPEDEPPSGGVSALRDRFRGMPMPSATGPPPAPVATKPPPEPEYEDEEPVPQPAARFVPPPPAPVQPQRTPTPSPPGSPARIAMPVARGSAPVPEVPLDTRPRSPSPDRSRVAAAVGAGVGIAAVGAGIGVAVAASSGKTELTGRRARIIYDYEKAEDNEIDLVEGQVVGMIEMVDEDWWQGTNESGETGLFPSNYVEPIMDDEDEEPEPEPVQPAPEPVFAAAVKAPPTPEPEPELAAGGGHSAKAIYDYEAAEENELSFPEGATITDIEFPDEDWWFGRYGGHEGLFPSNYVELDQ
ncbi:Vinexin [Dactylella cylindrospora]|nr:Vinexin [Dactylella cylindrospora]